MGGRPNLVQECSDGTFMFWQPTKDLPALIKEEMAAL